MPQGNYIQLSGEFTDDSLPRYYPADAQLNKGSLILIEPANPLSGISAFPSSSQVLKNLAWDIAKTMIPAGTETTLSPVVINTLTLGEASFAELTPKKGLHVIVSKEKDIASGNEFIINLGSTGLGGSPLIRDYILDHPTHEFYFSAWYEKTRAADQTVSSDFFFMESTGAFKFSMNAVENVPGQVANPANFVGVYNSQANPNTVAKHFRAVGAKGYWGALNANRALIPFYFKFTSAGPFGGFEVNKHSSNCLYRLYVEDLTVSGRTFTQARTADKEAFDAAFANGGKFEGDVLTNPATLP